MNEFNLNPYESPNTRVAAGSRPKRLLALLFLINFSTSLFVAVASAYALIASEDQIERFSGGVLLLRFSLYALCELATLLKPTAFMYSILSTSNLGAAAFATFGVVANVGEALVYDNSLDFTFLICFVLVGGGVAAYLAFSGYYRWKL